MIGESHNLMLPRRDGPDLDDLWRRLVSWRVSKVVAEIQHRCQALTTSIACSMLSIVVGSRMS